MDGYDARRQTDYAQAGTPDRLAAQLPEEGLNGAINYGWDRTQLSGIGVNGVK